MRKLLCVVPLFLSACGGGTAPELYNLVIDFFKLPDSCYANGMPPSQTTTASPPSLMQVSVWEGAANEAFLEIDTGSRTVDMGSAPDVQIAGVFRGTKGSGGWTFTGERNSQQVVPGVGTTTVDASRASITFERGGAFKGTVSLSSSRTCTGAGCGTNTSCTVDNISVNGTRIQVQYQKSP